MSEAAEVEVFRTDDYVPAGRIPLAPLLRRAFDRVLGHPTRPLVFHLTFLQITDPTVIGRSPTMENLRSSHGYVTVRITSNGELLYQHPHSVRELVGAPLRRLLHEQEPEEQHWAFGIRAPGLEGVPLVRPAPTAPGQVDVVVRPGRSRRFHIEKLPDPEPPPSTLAGLGVPDTAGLADDPIAVVVEPAAHAALTRTMRLSDEVEEGGFLVGRVWCDAERPERYLVVVSGAVPAERTGASLLHFTFTGESFLRMAAQLDGHGDGLVLVGWYHTHLFPATEELGLSSIDVDLHTTTFRAPWQVAGLLNLERSRRVLRFYRAGGDGMVDAWWRTAQEAATA